MTGREVVGETSRCRKLMGGWGEGAQVDEGASHQQKGTWLQLPYHALLCLIELIRHNKA